MMSSLFRMPTAASLLAIAGSAIGASPAPQSAPEASPIQPVFVDYDRDRNDTLSPAELAGTAMATSFTTLDRDGDGFLSRVEFNNTAGVGIELDADDEDDDDAPLSASDVASSEEPDEDDDGAFADRFGDEGDGD